MWALIVLVSDHCLSFSLCKNMYVRTVGRNMGLHPFVHLGIVSLTSPLRGQLITCFTTLQSNTRIFLLKKMRETSHILFNKNIGLFDMLTFKSLTSR